MKVLIIDDDKLVSLSLKTILEASGKIEIIGTGEYGQNVFGDEITGKLPALMKLSPEMKNFESYDISKKEQKIISLVAEGLNNREIAERLFLSEGTVRNYLSQILEKLELRDRTQLAVFYYRGTLPPV